MRQDLAFLALVPRVPYIAALENLLKENLVERPPWREQFRRSLVFVRPYRRLALSALGLILVGAVLSALEPLAFMYLFDQLAGGEPAKALAYGLLMYLGLGLAREGLGGIANWMTWRVRLRVSYHILDATVDRLHALPVTYHRNQSVGGILTMLDKGVQGYISAMHEFVFNILPAFVYLAMALVFMTMIDWRLTLLVLAFTPIPGLIGVWAVREQMVRERSLIYKWGQIYSRFNEVLTGIVTVKSFSMEDAEKDRFLREVRDANGVVDKGVARDTAVGASKNLVALVARVSAIGLGALFILQGQITVGAVLAFLGYIGGFFGPVQGLTNTYQTIKRASVSLDAIYSILDAEMIVADKPGARDVESVRGLVEFEDVSFHYSKPGRPILDHVTLRVEPGETIAIVGPSGSGKTTLMALLQRLYDPAEGVIRVDGTDVRELKQRSLRQHVGVVLQDALLFNDSIRNAIAYARPDATPEQIERVAKAAQAHDFIAALPSGYETQVGERGGRLSGGERQRIAIARALLKDPPILILDEATSALDAESEAHVQEALAALVKGRTTFIIAHRLSTVVNADRILVLQEGRIAEAGTHGELMALNGYYASLVRHQTKGLIKGLRDWPGEEQAPTPAPAAEAAASDLPAPQASPPVARPAAEATPAGQPYAPG